MHVRLLLPVLLVAELGLRYHKCNEKRTKTAVAIVDKPQTKMLTITDAYRHICLVPGMHCIGQNSQKLAYIRARNDAFDVLSVKIGVEALAVAI